MLSCRNMIAQKNCNQRDIKILNVFLTYRTNFFIKKQSERAPIQSNWSRFWLRAKETSIHKAYCFVARSGTFPEAQSARKFDIGDWKNRVLEEIWKLKYSYSQRLFSDKSFSSRWNSIWKYLIVPSSPDPARTCSDNIWENKIIFSLYPCQLYP